MKYCLQGHDRDNGVQEMLISLLPDEPHDWVLQLPEDAEGCRSLAWEAGGAILSRAEIRMGEKRSAAQVESPLPAGADGEEYKRILTYTVKTAVYRALLPFWSASPCGAVSRGSSPPSPPVWPSARG